ncbi:MAG TPA: hypothetical protein VK766_05570 [Cytophagaceae bacterium]|jgi:hypothetical protein|nr:hypothetical protein [Cytophagaceae bacterium]
MNRIKLTSIATLFFLVFLFINGSNAFAQFGNKLKHGLRFYLDTKDSSRFITLNMTSQIWARYTQNNPGTTVENFAQNSTTDMSVRRIRFVMSGVLTDRINFFMQFGQNNLNYLSPRKAGSFFHDITMDYAVIKKYLSIGGGLNGWNGPSRFSNTSVSSILVLDPPNYQEVTNDTYDQFVRRLGVYAKGKIGKIDYRVSVGKPFVIQTASGSGIAPINKNSSQFSTLPPKLVYQGYFSYQFLDQESNFAPSMVGSYLGKKRVLNLGGGFYYQKNAMMLSGGTTGTDTLSQDLKLVALDLFYDTPINREKGTAYSLYACYSNYNYGTNFVKVTGPDNPASGSNRGTTNFDKANYGNAFPYIGTGSTFYLQTAYKFADSLLGKQGTIQPYIDAQYSIYKALSGPMFVYDVGINWLINGNHAKITLDYQNRPYFTENTIGQLKQNKRLGEFVVQYQVAF